MLLITLSPQWQVVSPPQVSARSKGKARIAARNKTKVNLECVFFMFSIPQIKRRD
jgi:hypothetical protein